MVAEAERNRRIQAAKDLDLMTVEQEDIPLFYLSFCDSDRAAQIPAYEQIPGGPSWLGACFVPALEAGAAVAAAHRLRCNPGGEVAILGPMDRSAVKPDFVGRLLKSADEVDAAAAADA